MGASGSQREGILASHLHRPLPPGAIRVVLLTFGQCQGQKLLGHVQLYPYNYQIFKRERPAFLAPRLQTLNFPITVVRVPGFPGLASTSFLSEFITPSKGELNHGNSPSSFKELA